MSGKGRRAYNKAPKKEKLRKNYHAVVKGKRVHLGYGDGMQVPCTLMIEGSKCFIVRLQEQLSLT